MESHRSPLFGISYRHLIFSPNDSSPRLYFETLANAMQEILSIIALTYKISLEYVFFCLWQF